MRKFLNELGEVISMILAIVFCLLLIAFSFAIVLGIPTYCIIQIIEAIK